MSDKVFNSMHECTYEVRLHGVWKGGDYSDLPEYVLILDKEHGPLFWRSDSCGYTSDYRIAGLYSKAEAISIIEGCSSRKQMALIDPSKIIDKYKDYQRPTTPEHSTGRLG